MKDHLLCLFLIFANLAFQSEARGLNSNSQTRSGVGLSQSDADPEWYLEYVKLANELTPREVRETINDVVGGIRKRTNSEASQSGAVDARLRADSNLTRQVLIDFEAFKEIYRGSPAINRNMNVGLICLYVGLHSHRDGRSIFELNQMGNPIIREVIRSSEWREIQEGLYATPMRGGQVYGVCRLKPNLAFPRRSEIAKRFPMPIKPKKRKHRTLEDAARYGLEWKAYYDAEDRRDDAIDRAWDLEVTKFHQDRWNGVQNLAKEIMDDVRNKVLRASSE